MLQKTRKLLLSSAAVTLIMLIVSSGLPEAAARDPLVETGVSRLAPDGTWVRVNAWPLLTMELETRGPNKGYKMNQSILSGLIGMTMDRSLDPATGRIMGPVKVSLLGLTLYDNEQARPILPTVNIPAMQFPTINMPQQPGINMQAPSLPAMPTFKVTPGQA